MKKEERTDPQMQNEERKEGQNKAKKFLVLSAFCHFGLKLELFAVAKLEFSLETMKQEKKIISSYIFSLCSNVYSL